ncbi:MAG: hypothetical protein GX657_02210 [Chloroflexi bacterium]|jgi:chromosome segregation ATPase|nr:hypothetical protein [Chloroflexota bacterium]
MSIGQSQISTSWLDEELRKKSVLIEELRDVIDKQQLALADQAQRIAGLESRLTKLQTQVGQIPEVHETIQHTRDELVLQIGDVRQEIQKREADQLRSRQAERERDMQALNNTVAELGRLSPLEQAAAAAKVESHRLNEVVMRLQDELQGAIKRFAQQEDTGRMVGDHVEKVAVRVGQAEVAMQEQREVQQVQATRVLLLEGAIPKLEQQVAELQGVRSEITKHQEELLENQRLADRTRAQAMTEWGRKIEQFEHQLQIWGDQMRFYADQHEKNRKVLRDIQEVTHQVSQQQDQLKQVQRIGEDQIRHEVLDFRTEIERRLAQEIERRKVIDQQRIQLEDQVNRRIAELEQGRKQDIGTTVGLSDRIRLMQRDLETQVARLEEVMLSLFQKRADAAQLLLSDLKTVVSKTGSAKKDE